MNHRIWILIVLAGISGLAFAQIPAPATLPATRPMGDLPALLKQLGVDDWKQRDLAQGEIVRIGSESLPKLRQVSESTSDEEVRQRVLTAISRIEDEQLVGQSLITLNMTDATVDKVFAEISRQALAPLPLKVSDEWRAAAAKITIKTDHQPFWDVMRTICPKVGLHPQWLGESFVWAEGYTNELAGRAVVSGPFLILLKKAERHTSISAGRLNRSARLDLQAVVMAEPKLHMLSRATSFTIKSAEDGQGRPMRSQPTYTGVAMGLQGIYSLAVGLTPEPDATKIKSMTCELPVVLGLRPQTITIDKPMEAGARKLQLEDGELIVGPVKQQGNAFQLAFECEQSVFNGVGGNFNNMVRMYDSEGAAFRQQGWQQNGFVNGRMRGAINFGPPVPKAVPDKVTCTVESERRQITVESTFVDVPLP